MGCHYHDTHPIFLVLIDDLVIGRAKKYRLINFIIRSLTLMIVLTKKKKTTTVTATFRPYLDIKSTWKRTRISLKTISYELSNVCLKQEANWYLLITTWDLNSKKVLSLD